ncbi:TonB-dependent receptor [Parasegetibacter sp. NRK P23]|uniref:SusC/RagA family TonB-linked outer membrane protein n=1 Tax=Parasegetibacter sp. NRK P23 TaxID=2942999 RepID=UPI0020447726|nr:TonB-dependent receptor [Parasegetibacter sp. NRK P23]MCM5530542.1 TonB-dependent receptor [Parasegetibacter sp. NRK P23]
MRNSSLRRVILTLCGVFILLLSYAQEKVITGIISDEKGTPLANATVSAKGQKKSVTSNANGAFSITLPQATTTLSISYVGMRTQDIAIGNRSNILVTLNVAEDKMNEVVVIGYGTRRRGDISSSISTVTEKDIKDLPVSGIDQALQGKVAGVTVTNNTGQPGGGVSVKVRGVTTINSNDPLIVIDGVPFFSNTRSSAGFAGLGGADGQTGNSVMATLNPNDIESVDILKDASAQAIYGSQAANGVILITTKKGKKGEGKINYDVYVGQARIANRLDLMNLREFAQYHNEVAVNPIEEFTNPELLGEGTDWQEAMFRTGQIQNHQLSFSGGKDKTNYYLSMNYFDQTGTLLGSDFKRYSTRFNLDHQLKNWLKMGVSANASRSIQNITLADAAPGAIFDATILNPLTPLKNLDGTWGAGNSTDMGGFRPDIGNPIAESHFRGTKLTNTQVFGNIYAEILFLKNFSFRNEVSYSLGLNNNLAYQRSGNIGTRALQSQLFDRRGNSYYYALRNYVNYNKYFGKHGITATAGHEAQYSYYEEIGGKKVDLQNNILDLNSGNSDKETWELNGGKNQWAMESYFARGTYAYDNRYALSLSIRADGSSNFGPNNKWGYFPGASFAWTLTNERFAANITNTVNNLKIRLGYGLVGNQNLPSGAQNPPYTSAIGFWPGPVGFGNSSYLNGITNPDLSWESVETKNLGIDASFLNNRIDLTVDVYRKTTKDMLLFLTGPRLIGVGDQWDDLKAPIGNDGQMSNTGIDISINSQNIRKENFTWRTNLIFSHFKNKLDKMANSTAGLTGRVYFDNYTLTYTNPGYAVGSFFGLVTDGLFRTQEDLDNSMPQFGYTVKESETWFGDVRFKDISGPNGKPDGIIDASDITYIGSPLPKFTFGLTNSFTYKDVDLSIFLQGNQGSKIFNFLRWRLEKNDNAYFNQSKAVMDRYTTSNTDGSVPRYVIGQVNNIAMSDRYVEDGSYLRIQNITLGYRLPKSIIGKAGIANVRFYASVQNLKTFTKYTGLDPEIGAFNNNIRLMNVDMGHYPVPRTFTVGANIEL